MDLQNFAPEKRQNVAEKLESREASPEQLAREMLREGDSQVTALKSRLQEFKRADVMLDTADLEAELDAAWDELNTEIAAAQKPDALLDEPESWDVAETTAAESPESPEVIEKFGDEVSDFVEQPELDCGKLEEFCQNAEKSPKMKELLVSALEGKVGTKYARIIAENKEYRTGLKELSDALRGRLEEDGPVKMIDMNLGNLLAVKEVVGAGAAKLVEAFNLKKYSPDLKHYPEGGMVLVQELRFDPDSGEIISAQVDFGIDCETPDNQTARIQREFILSTQDAEDGSIKRKTQVNHKLLDFPPSMKQGGLAAKITREAMTGYDAAELDEIVLHANIDMGGYSWATYGYGWDDDAMALEEHKKSFVSEAAAKFDATAREAFAMKLEAEKPGITPSKIKDAVNVEAYRRTKSAEAESRRQFRKVESKQRLELRTKKVGELVDFAKNKYLAAAEAAGLSLDDPGLQKTIKQFEELLSRPETVTPQELALVGRDDGPKLRQGKSGKWYTPEAFTAAVAANEDSENPDLKGDLHPGKLAMTGKDFEWYGKIELKQEGAQKGKNRSLLEKKINRAE